MEERCRTEEKKKCSKRWMRVEKERGELKRKKRRVCVGEEAKKRQNFGGLNSRTK